MKCALYASAFVQCKVYGVPHALGMGPGVCVVCLCEIPCTVFVHVVFPCEDHVTSHGVSGRVLV